MLTPHPGEMARLAGRSTAEVQADRLLAARELAERLRRRRRAQGLQNRDRVAERARRDQPDRQSGDGERWDGGRAGGNHRSAPGTGSGTHGSGRNRVFWHGAAARRRRETAGRGGPSGFGRHRGASPALMAMQAGRFCARHRSLTECAQSAERSARVRCSSGWKAALRPIRSESVRASAAISRRAMFSGFPETSGRARPSSFAAWREVSISTRMSSIVLRSPSLPNTRAVYGSTISTCSGSASRFRRRRKRKSV